MSSLADIYKGLNIEKPQVQSTTTVAQKNSTAPTTTDQPAPSADQKNAKGVKDLFNELLDKGGSPQLKGG